MNGALRFLGYLLRLTVLWSLLFLVQRALFLALNLDRLHGLSIGEILLTQRHGQAMDLSMTGYLLLPAVLLSIPLAVRDTPHRRRILHAYLVAIALLSCTLTLVDVGLYRSWGSRVNLKAISYLAYPREVAASVTGAPLLVLIPTLLLLCTAAVLALRRVRPAQGLDEGGWGWKGGTLALSLGLCLLAARGGPQELPISKSWAYFSRHSVLNLAALNGTWNFMELLVKPPEFRSNPYAYLPEAEASMVHDRLHHGQGGPATRLLRTERPNIILVLLESWTAGVIAPLGGDTGVAPQFTRLAREGLLFRNFHSTGFRTEQGICATLSSFPSQPRTTIIRKFGKFDQLPSLVRELGRVGYTSTYFYAGDVEFANTRSYLGAMGFEVVHDEHSFPIKQRTRWGAFDEELFDFHLQRTASEKAPFFHIIMTSTSHEPFDAPVEEGFQGGEPQRYRNTVHYTDRCLGDFIDRARKAWWWDNTLVIVMADHGHFLPHRLEAHEEARHRIPFLLLGGALEPALRGTVNDTYASHVDVAATILHQLGLSAAQHEWSNDVFDPTVAHRAFWTFDEGFGIADSVQTVVWDHVGQRVLELRDSSRTADRDRLLREGRAELQVLLDRYIGFNQ